MATFRAIGGLGNQLFVLAAALAYSETFHTNVDIDLRRAAKGKDQGGPHSQSSSLLSFMLNDKPIAILAASSLASCALDYYASIEHRILSSISNSIQSTWCHTSSTVGFDAKVLESRKIRYFRGYFQSYRYLQYVKESGRGFNLSLINPSSTYLELKKQLNSGRKTVVHIRRGDYVKVSKTFGLLDHKYYARGLELLGSQDSLGRILVFSDNPLVFEDKSLRKVFEDFGAELVETSDMDPAESLMLMASGSNFVIANSSFSWWAAALSGTANVVFPELWFRSEPQPKELNPPSWTPLKSSWLE